MKPQLPKIIFLAVGFLLASCNTSPQKQETPASLPPQKAESVQETYEFDAVIDALYASITFDKERTPDYAGMKRLFLETAELISNNGPDPNVFTPNKFVEILKGQIASGALTAFTEREISHKTHVFGKIAHRFSTYEADYMVNGEKKTTLGINSIQLININGSWYISSLIWNDENEVLKIPEEYLPLSR